MSTLFVNNLNTASGSTITVPTGKKLVVTDAGGVQVPHMVGQMVQSGSISGSYSGSISGYISGSNSAYQRIDYFKNKDLILSDTIIMGAIGPLDTLTLNGINYTSTLHQCVRLLKDRGTTR